jgi:membrane-bound lytic murein transglycosylase F
MNLSLTKKSPLNLFFIGLFFVGILQLQGCEYTEKKSNLQKILDRGYIRIGTLFGTSSYYATADGYSGFEYELAKQYADHLGVELKVVPSYQLKTLFRKLDNNTVDFLAAGLAATSSRLAQYKFAPSYNEVSQKLVFKQGNTWPREIESLQGDLLVLADSSHSENLLLLEEKYPQLAWKETVDFDNEELLIKVLAGEINYTIIDSHALAMSRHFYPEISVAFTIKDPEPLAWALNKKLDDSLLSSLIEFFGEVHHDGTLFALNDKYYGHVEDFNYVDTRLFIKAVAKKLPKYQHLFEKYANDIDWKLLAALSYQESHWNPKARSYTGVRGLMMLTLATAKQMGVASRLDPEQSIQGGAKYFQRMINKIPDRIPTPDRTWFALASYNVGFGHLNDARIITQRQGGDPDRWYDVKSRLPLLKQKKYYQHTKYGYARGDEPVRYVESIRRYYESLSFLDDKAKEAKENIAIKAELDELTENIVIEHANIKINEKNNS